MYAQLNYKAAMKPNRKTARLQIRLTQDLAERLEALSALTEIPVSLYIRNALTQGLKKWESELVPESLTAFGVQS